MFPGLPVLYTLGGLVILHGVVNKVLPKYIKYCDHEKERKHEKYKIAEQEKNNSINRIILQ